MASGSKIVLGPQFTPGAERALAAAAGWSQGEATAGIELPELLLGLLAEPECRSALALAARGIDAEAVRARWPALAPASTDSRRLMGDAPAVRAALQAAQAWLGRTPPEAWGTEHLLLGVVAAEHEAAEWLATAGFDAAVLAEEIQRRAAGEKVGLAPEPTGGAEDARGVDTSAFEGLAIVGPSVRLAAKAEAAAWRAIDAAANRAREGLRVVEDHARFVLDDRHLTEALKSLRHELREALGLLPDAARLAMRETQADVGTTLLAAGEMVRGDCQAVAASNFKRVQEALRSLEEFGKLVSVEFAARVERLRYRAYTLEKALATTAWAIERLADVRLYVLIEGRESLAEFEQYATDLVAVGVDCLQLRDKRLADRELLERARCLRRVTAGTPTLFVMNDRPDLARLAEADGVHVGQEELTVKDARAIVGPRMLVGVSTHTIAQARAAVLDGADYIGVGPVFRSGTKAFSQFPGLELLRAVAAEIRLPAFAIGGIDEGNLEEVLRTGVTRVAVSGAIANAADPAGAARALKQRLST